jgi:hypothetical protein
MVLAWFSYPFSDSFFYFHDNENMGGDLARKHGLKVAEKGGDEVLSPFQQVQQWVCGYLPSSKTWTNNKPLV